MDTWLFLGFAAAYSILLVVALLIARRRGRWTVADLVSLVLAALIYDNAVIGLGRFIGEGALLAGLSEPRFWLHALCTPLLVLVGWDLMARADIAWARTRAASITAWVVTVALVGYEIVTSAARLDLAPEIEHDVLRYTHTGAHPGPPVIVLVVALALLVAGVALFRAVRWPWLLVATVLMVIGAGIPNPFPSGAVTNAFELILLIGVLASIAMVDRTSSPRPLAARIG